MLKQEVNYIEKDGKKVKVIEYTLVNGIYPKKIGKIYYFNGKRVLYKKVNSQKHKFRLFDAYGIQEELFKLLKGKNGYVRIDEEDTGTILKSPIKVWEDKGVIRNYGEAKQRFLSIKYMDCYKIIKS